MKSFTLRGATALGRRGALTTAHGTIQTPFFMPIATKGSVKSLLSEDLHALGAEILLSNTYHLLLRPGPEVLKAGGGLHSLMHWDGPILTDSGGYQVFSLAAHRSISDEGVVFRSHLDGSKHLLTPETALEIQEIIGSDIRMVLDDVRSPEISHDLAREAMERTLQWAARSKASWKQTDSAQLFGIVQGGVYEDLRTECATRIQECDFDGYAIGGLAVGETEEQMMQMTELVTQKLPPDRPRYFMGGARPDQIVKLVERGVDMFDCVIPTREARHGRLYLWNPDASLNDANFYRTINLLNQEFEQDFSPLDPSVVDSLVPGISRAYLRHLFMSQEPVALRIATLHNLQFYLTLLRRIRGEIEKNLV